MGVGVLPQARDVITPASALLERAFGRRQGVVSRLHPVPRTLSDVDVAGFAAVPEPFAAGGTSGGAAFEPEQAERAAIAEALERYAAARSPMETVTEPGATQELVERDAFTTTWLHGLAPPRLSLPEELRTGDVRAFDLTPAYSPHPVVAVTGTLPIAGRERPPGSTGRRRSRTSTGTRSTTRALGRVARAAVVAGRAGAATPQLHRPR